MQRIIHLLFIFMNKFVKELIRVLQLVRTFLKIVKLFQHHMIKIINNLP